MGKLAEHEENPPLKEALKRYEHDEDNMPQAPPYEQTESCGPQSSAEQLTVPDPEAPGGEFMISPIKYSDPQFLVFFVSISLGFYAAFLGTLPTWNLLVLLGSRFDTLKGLTWIVPTLLFCQSASSILFGRLSDFVGRRWIFVVGNLTSFVGFLAAGLIEDLSTLVGLSSIIGLGTGIQFLGPFLALAELLPVKDRFTMVGLSMSLFAPLIALTPAIAKGFIDHTSRQWRWCYHINAILSFVSMVGLFVSYHPPTYEQIHKGNPISHKVKVKDWIGLLAVTVATGMLQYSLLWVKLIYPWSSPQVIALIVIGVVILLSFLVYEYFWGGSDEGYAAYLIQSWNSLSQIAVACLTTLLLWFMPVASKVICVTVLGWGDWPAIWVQCCWPAGFVAGTILATIALRKPKYLRWQLAASTIIAVVFVSALGVASPSKLTTTKVCLVFIGIGLGYTMVLTYVTAPMTAHKNDMGLVTGFISGFRNLGFAVLDALFITIYEPQLVPRLKSHVMGLLRYGKSAEDPVPYSPGQLQVPEHGPISLYYIKAAIVDSGTDAWKFIFYIANIWVGLMIILVMISANTDGFLSSEMWAKMRPFRLHAYWPVFKKTNEKGGEGLSTNSKQEMANGCERERR